MIDHPEPLKTLIEKQIHTAACDNYVRSHLYNVLWHNGSRPFDGLQGYMEENIQRGLVNFPSLTFMEAVNLVEIAQHAIYRGSFRSGAEWAPDTISINVSDELWLHNSIRQIAGTHLRALMLHAVSQLCMNLSEVIRTLRFRDPWLLGGHDVDGLVSEVKSLSRVSSSPLGKVYHTLDGQLYMQELKSISIYVFEHGLTLRRKP